MRATRPSPQCWARPQTVPFCGDSTWGKPACGNRADAKKDHPRPSSVHNIHNGLGAKVPRQRHETYAKVRTRRPPRNAPRNLRGRRLIFSKQKSQYAYKSAYCECVRARTIPQPKRRQGNPPRRRNLFFNPKACFRPDLQSHLAAAGPSLQSPVQSHRPPSNIAAVSSPSQRRGGCLLK